MMRAPLLLAILVPSIIAAGCQPTLFGNGGSSDAPAEHTPPAKGADTTQKERARGESKTGDVAQPASTRPVTPASVTKNPGRADLAVSPSPASTPPKAPSAAPPKDSPTAESTAKTASTPAALPATPISLPPSAKVTVPETAPPKPTSASAPANPALECRVPKPQPAAYLHVKVTAFANMEHGYHVLEEDSIFQLVKDGKVVVAGYATMDAAIHSQPTDGNGAYPGMILRLDASYVSSLTHDSGQLFMCRGPIGEAPEKAQCVKESRLIRSDSSRPAAILGAPVSWKLKTPASDQQLTRDATAIPEIEIIGQNFNVSTYHPVFAAAVPGGAFKDFQSPLVLDLSDNQKFDLIDVWDDTSPIRFDLKADGQKSRTGWVLPQDGMLALDINGNGKIDSGLELFGEYSFSLNKGGSHGPRFQNGFEALAQYDRNDDGVIDNKDPIFPQLTLWRDLNSNGVSEARELANLAAHQITAIHLAYKAPHLTAQRYVASNDVRILGIFTTRDGKRHPIADIWFKQRRFTDSAIAARQKDPRP